MRREALRTEGGVKTSSLGCRSRLEVVKLDEASGSDCQAAGSSFRGSLIQADAGSSRIFGRPMWCRTESPTVVRRPDRTRRRGSATQIPTRHPQHAGRSATADPEIR